MIRTAIVALSFALCPVFMQPLGALVVYDAQTDWDAAIRLDSKDAIAYFNRGQILNEKDDRDQAIAAFNQAIWLERGWAPPYGGRGVAYKSKQDYDNAIRDFNEAIRLDPKQDFYYRHRGDAFAFKHEYERALGDFTEATSMFSASLPGLKYDAEFKLC